MGLDFRCLTWTVELPEKAASAGVTTGASFEAFERARQLNHASVSKAEALEMHFVSSLAIWLLSLLLFRACHARVQYFRAFCLLRFKWFQIEIHHRDDHHWIN